MTDVIVKMALRLAALERMRRYKTSVLPLPDAPEIVRGGVDGPYLMSLSHQRRWLSPWERLLTKLGIWDAWDIEWRRFPLPASVGRNAERQDAEERLGPKDEHAVPKADAQTTPNTPEQSNDPR